MKLNRCLKKILWIMAGALIILAVVLANRAHNNTIVKDLVVIVDYSGNDTLVTAEQIREQALYDYRDIKRTKIKDLNLKKIEHSVGRNKFVENIGVSVTIGGNVLIDVAQRTPLVRVFMGDTQFYLDTEGKYMPISNLNNQYILIASGYIKKDFSCDIKNLDAKKMNTNFQKYDIAEIYKLASFLKNDEKSAALFDQIYINQQGELEIIPKLGDYTILVGNTENLDEKLENLYALYEKAFSNIGWNNYSKINLKYNNQIICTKK